VFDTHFLNIFFGLFEPWWLESEKAVALLIFLLFQAGFFFKHVKFLLSTPLTGFS